MSTEITIVVTEAVPAFVALASSPAQRNNPATGQEFPALASYSPADQHRWRMGQ
jgi:hypothetical protein